MAQTWAGPIEVRAALAKISDGFTIPKTYKSNKKEREREKKRKKERRGEHWRQKQESNEKAEGRERPSITEKSFLKTMQKDPKNSMNPINIRTKEI